MFKKKFEDLEKRLVDIEHLLADPKIISDQPKCLSLAKELSALVEPVRDFRKWKKITLELVQLENVLEEKHDQEFLDLAKAEIEVLEATQKDLGKKLEQFLLGEDKDASLDVIVEIRAGTGGQEASLFAADLFRMYSRFADKCGWRAEILSSHPSEAGGFKEVIFSVRGKDAFRKLRFESGVHRVQRVPVTEASGRIHTSAATVAVLPEAKEADVKVDPKDLKIDVFKSSGPGGQSVNTTDSAVRITHLPSGLVIICQDERSQLKNKYKAMRVLRTRLLEAEREKNENEISNQRRSQIRSGDRSEKIRTYNFSEHRVTDHRIGLVIHRLEEILEGSLDEIIQALIENEDKDKRKRLMNNE
ncbi:MAG: peptide chain release factor 1 [Candidatus Omnitrophica bacterium]|nr:peptide chain release factor 1 [Candidatus Omnitrophota bacterium]